MCKVNAYMCTHLELITKKIIMHKIIENTLMLKKSGNDMQTYKHLRLNVLMIL